MYLYRTKFLNKKSKDYIIYITVLLIVYNWDLWIHNFITFFQLNVLIFLIIISLLALLKITFTMLYLNS